jgi:hypothetical protein
MNKNNQKKPSALKQAVTKSNKDRAFFSFITNKKTNNSFVSNESIPKVPITTKANFKSPSRL